MAGVLGFPPMARRTATHGGPDLFAAEGERVRRREAPLAERMRPRTLEEFVGQTHLVGPGRLVRDMIDGQRLHSLILWGPPGSGKTTLALLIANSIQAHFVHFSAVLSGVRELRELIAEAQEQLRMHGRRTILFVDEIHRFNKAQQDAFLPYVEDGTVTLIGATTENPSFEVIAPLLSRTSVLVLEPLPVAAVRELLERALDGSRARARRARPAHRTRRRWTSSPTTRVATPASGSTPWKPPRIWQPPSRRQMIDLPLAEEAAQHRALLYDKAGEEHYNIISAFIKSMRDSDPDAAVYWMMRMLEAGEDPLFIARRMIIFAAEDVGNADPRALQVAVAAKDAFHFVGLPEGRIPLAQAVTYLAVGAEVECLVQGHAGGGRRREAARAAAGAAAPAQRADAADEGPRLRPRLQVRTRLRRTRRGASNTCPTRSRTGATTSRRTSATNAPSRNASIRLAGCVRAQRRGTVANGAQQVRRERTHG